MHFDILKRDEIDWKWNRERWPSEVRIIDVYDALVYQQ